MLFFHEPWTDEAQAWMIAKYASYQEMLFTIPHYEGHPPFLYLIYSIPAKLGLPFRPVIQMLHLISVAVMVGIVEFRLGLTNIVKTFLPFTVFFVQYSVMSRPYVSLICMLFLVLSMKKTRNDEPVRYVMALGLLCCTHLYGIAIAGGIAISWLIDIAITGKKFFKDLFSSNRKRLFALCGLLVFALIEILTIFPADDCYSILGSWNDLSFGRLLTSLGNLLLILPSEMTVTNLDYSLSSGNYSTPGIIILPVISITIWILLFMRARRTKTLRDIIPPLLCFMAVGVMYLFYHHYGVYLALLVYCFIVTRDASAENKRPVVLSIGITAFLFMSVFWTGIYCFDEITSKCYPGSDLNSWIDENNIRDYNWMSFCGSDSPNMVSEPVIAADAEYGKLLCSNYFLNRPYVSWIKLSEEQKREAFAEWGRSGAPDFIIVNTPLNYPITDITDLLGVSDDYVPVFFGYYRYFVKGCKIEIIVHIWMRKDLEDSVSVRKEFGDYRRLVEGGVYDYLGVMKNTAQGPAE
jgi:hypothetical protein